MSGLLIAMHTQVSVEGGRTNCHHLKCVGVWVLVCAYSCVGLWACEYVCDLDVLLIHWRRKTWPDSRQAKEHDWQCMHICVYVRVYDSLSCVYVPAMLHDWVSVWKCVCPSHLRSWSNLPVPPIIHVEVCCSKSPIKRYIFDTAATQTLLGHKLCWFHICIYVCTCI